ncbi:MAG: LCP family protein [Mycobacterium sp.]
MPSRSARPLAIAARLITALAAVVILVVTGMAWAGNRNLFGGITVSQALEGVPGSTGGDQNILIMGLDSRLDEHGRPLPQEMYDALHAGDETAGGYNANVLIVVHVPGGTGPITAISIPRDDYVDLASCPGCTGKIKQAYGLAYQRAMDSIDSESTTADTADPAANEQKAREAGRKAQISTVRNLLGIPIDHFIEVTLVAFFQIATVVQPITVCLNDDTYDSFSGADFHKGVQQIDAAQAMAFVRQRRDVNDEMFTDLDRTRRQQAFIVSLLSALRHNGSLGSPSDLHKLLDVARQNIAVDARLDLSGFIQQASAFTDRGVSLYTLPITSFTQDSAGEDVNTIDVPAIRSIVRNITAGGSPEARSASTTGTPSSARNEPLAAATGVALNVVNASDFAGAATRLLEAFSGRGFRAGEATTAESIADETTVTYGPGAQAAGEALARQLNLVATPSARLARDTVQVTVGMDFPSSDYLIDTETSTTTSTTTTPATPVATVSATATGTRTPAPTDLTRMTTDQAPCVK